MFSHKFFRVASTFLVFIFILSVSTLSYSRDNTPYHVVKNTTDTLVSVLNENQESFKNNPQTYQKVVEEILISVVDFEIIAKFVMGKSHYHSATEEQRKNFELVIKDNLITTYSTALSLLKGQHIQVFKPQVNHENKFIMSISTLLKTDQGEVFPLRFTLRKGETGTWKIVNVILNGLNVGKAYNLRFNDGVEMYQGNIDQLIANWGSAETTPKQIKVSKYSDSSIKGWKEIVFDGKTNYKNQNDCVLATANASASGLISEVRINLSSNTRLSWGWTAEEQLQKRNDASEKTKEGDDFLARVYVIHEGFFPWQTKAINYVWSKESKIGDHWSNPFLKNAHMVVVQSGNESIGEWKYFERDIKADFKKYLDTDIDKIDAIAVMTDADNSKGRAEACYQMPEIGVVKNYPL
jgi:ABC-type transporter MlaC component